MKKWTVLLCFALMVSPLTAYGQETHQSIPPCSNPEIIEVALDVSASEVLENVAALADRMADAQSGDRVAIGVDLDEYQTLWWTEVIPQLPQCSFASEMGITVGRYLDEMLFSVAMTQIATSLDEQGEATSAALYTEIASRHTETATEYADKVSELVQVISPFM